MQTNGKMNNTKSAAVERLPMSPQELNQMVQELGYRRDGQMVTDFNETVGSNELCASKFSQHLTGAIKITNAWKSAYSLFYKIKKAAHV